MSWTMGICRVRAASAGGRNPVHNCSGKARTFECIFAGVDADGALKTETVDVCPSDTDGAVLHFAYHSEEAVGSDSPRLILSGQVAVLQSGFQDPQSPIALLPSFRAWVEAFQM